MLDELWLWTDLLYILQVSKLLRDRLPVSPSIHAAIKICKWYHYLEQPRLTFLFTKSSSLSIAWVSILYANFGSNWHRRFRADSNHINRRWDFDHSSALVRRWIWCSICEYSSHWIRCSTKSSPPLLKRQPQRRAILTWKWVLRITFSLSWCRGYRTETISMFLNWRPKS